MDAFILFLFLFGQLGPFNDVTPFDTFEECQEELKTLPAKIAEHNSKAENPKIFFFAASCKQVEKAPQGKEV